MQKYYRCHIEYTQIEGGINAENVKIFLSLYNRIVPVSAVNL